MANRFPLIVDSSGTAAIKELASGDNLDLTGNGIVGAGTVALTNLTVGGSQGTDGQVLTSTGSGVQWEDAASGGGGGAWNVISSQTISSSVAYVTFTGLTGYANYKIVWNAVHHANHPGDNWFQPSTDGGSTWYTTLDWQTHTTQADSVGTTLDVTANRRAGAGSSGQGQGAIYHNTHQYNTDQTHSGQLELFSFNGSNYTHYIAEDVHFYFATRMAFGKTRGALLSNTAFNAIRFGAGANFTGGTFTLYGLSTS